MLEIRGLRKKYGNFQALDGLDLEIPKGELFGLSDLTERARPLP